MQLNKKIAFQKDTRQKKTTCRNGVCAVAVSFLEDFSGLRCENALGKTNQKRRRDLQFGILNGET